MHPVNEGKGDSMSVEENKEKTQGIFKETENRLYRIPKNVRQVGQVQNQQKIYIEDYVMTFLKHMALEGVETTGLAVLLGKVVWKNGSKTIFVSGALKINADMPSEGESFSGETWAEIYDDIKKYFTNVEIMGWILGKSGLEGKLSEQIVKLHRNQFAGKDKVLILYDYGEKEETVFISDGNHLKKQNGYFIYYEKNEEMKNYMIEKKVKVAEAEPFEDRVVKDARRLMASREEKRMANNQYVKGAAVMVVAALAIIIGSRALNNADKLAQMENSLQNLTQTVQGDKGKTDVVAVSGEAEETKGEAEDAEDEADAATKAQDGSDGADEDANGDAEGKPGADTAEAAKDTDDATKNGADKSSTDNSSAPDGSADDAENDSDKSMITPSAGATPSPSSEAEDTGAAAKDKDNKKDDGGAVQPSSNSQHYYIVKEGDTLSEISYAMYKTMFRVDKIKEANNLEDENKIYVGQKLLIP